MRTYSAPRPFIASPTSGNPRRTAPRKLGGQASPSLWVVSEEEERPTWQRGQRTDHKIEVIPAHRHQHDVERLLSGEVNDRRRRMRLGVGEDVTSPQTFMGAMASVRSS
jgi:hypothetical protein